MTEEATIMQDKRIRVALDGRTVDLAQLSAEVGAGLCASDDEVVVADPASKVTRSALAKALAAHTPPPRAEPVQPLTDDEITRLRALLNSL